MPKVSVPSSQPGAGERGSEHGDLWGVIIAALKSKKPSLASALEHGRIITVTDSELVIGVTGSRFQVDLVDKRENRLLIEELVVGITSKKLSVKVQHLADARKQESKTKSEKKTKPEEQDPAVQDVLRVFPKGEVVEHDHPLD